MVAASNLPPARQELEAAPSPPPRPAVSLPEQRMIIHGVTWKDYVILREALDTPGLRMTYCEGVLELMSPSRPHELWTKMIARLFEVYALARDLPLYGYRSTTFRKEVKERGAEPDECYRVGRTMQDGQYPDIVVEVIHTNPLLDKLHVYDGFEVPEVWIFKEGRFEIYERKSEGGYVQRDRSPLVPALDFELLARFAVREDQHEAIKEFFDLMREDGPRATVPQV